MCFAEHPPGRLQVVCIAQQTQVVRLSRAAEGKWPAMFNGEIAPCAATPPLVIDKGALMTVTFPNQARDVNRDVARAWFELAPFARPFARLGRLRSPARSCATPSFIRIRNRC
jgi:hypothetical protein